LVYAADVISGAPLPNVNLRVLGKRAELVTGVTGADGIARIPLTAKGNVWIDGSTSLGPAFALSGVVTPPDPYVVYAITDRPIYRLGALVQYKATIRRWMSALTSSGRFKYETYADANAVVEIRDSTDALIEHQTVTTNTFGSLNGTFQLAPECGQGDWHFDVVLGNYTSYLTFTVHSYRKPEVSMTMTFDKQHYLCGGTAHALLSAQYEYGRPVDNMVVKYTVDLGDGSAPCDASGTTDEQGMRPIDVKTKRNSQDQTMMVNATLTDLSRRTYSTSATTLVAAGEFTLSL
jgi:uncharacterized protein YfaS (alpha-2-macroglobulin family)